MTESVSEILKNITPEELEKLRILAGIFGAGQLQPTLKEATVERGFSEYEKLVEFNLAPKSVRSVKLVNRRVMKFIPGNRIIGRIDKKTAESLIMKLAETAPKGVKTYLSTLNAEFNVFVEWDYTYSNPFQKIKLARRQKEEPKVFIDDEIILIKERLFKKEKFVIADMVVFSVNTGLRGGEIINLRWSDNDFKEKKLNVGSKHHKTKSRKIRIIPFNNTIEQILISNSQRQMANGKIIREFVFTQKNGKPYQLDTISKQLKRVIRELGLDEELHWHSLRATAASNWVNKKVPIYTVQKLLGHANVSTTQIYAKVDLSELRDAVNRL